MNYGMIKESDWKKFRAKLPVWQENYMDKLTKEYIEILRSNEQASSRFWALEKRIKEDRKSPGVVISPSRSEMEMDLFYLMRDGAITEEELNDFSEELSDRVMSLYRTFMD